MFFYSIYLKKIYISSNSDDEKPLTLLIKRQTSTDKNPLDTLLAVVKLASTKLYRTIYLRAILLRSENKRDLYLTEWSHNIIFLCCIYILVNFINIIYIFFFQKKTSSIIVSVQHLKKIAHMPFLGVFIHQKCTYVFVFAILKLFKTSVFRSIVKILDLWLNLRNMSFF